LSAVRLTEVTGSLTKSTKRRPSRMSYLLKIFPLFYQSPQVLSASPSKYLKELI